MSDFPLARILDFVRSVPPFDTLSQGELDRVVRSMDIAYFPPGTVVVRQGGEPARYLYVIQSGSVKITSTESDGRELLVDMRGEGDVFGALSLLHSEQGHFSVTTQEDLLCFVLPAEHFRDLVQTNPGFQRHFKFSLVGAEQSLRGLTDGFLVQMTGAEPLGEMAMQMHQRVEDLMSSEVLTCPPESTVREVAQAMTTRGVGSIVVVDGVGRPVGMVTDTDLRTKVLATGLAPGSPVEVIMSSPVHTMLPRSFAFEAMLEMTRQGTHHLVISEGGPPLGLISDHDFKVITGSSPVGLVGQIDKVDSLTQLTRLPRRIYRVLNLVLRMGVSAEYMVELLAEFADRLTLRIIGLSTRDMAREGLGGAPAPYAWLVLGASGRREHLPPSLQSHVLAFSGLEPEESDRACDWFRELGSRVSKGLAACGYPLGQPGLMAHAPGGCRSLEDWRDIYMSWVHEPVAREVAAHADFFDFRAVHDDGGLAGVLWSELRSAIERNRFFLKIMARSGFGAGLPLGFLRDSVVEQSGEYTKNLDLEGKVMAPVVEAARVLALDGGSRATGTFDRLDEVGRLGLITPELAAGLHEAYSFLSLMRIARHLEARARDDDAPGAVAVGSLNKAQRRMLKETFSVVGELMLVMQRRYGAALAGGESAA